MTFERNMSVVDRECEKCNSTQQQASDAATEAAAAAEAALQSSALAIASGNEEAIEVSEKDMALAQLQLADAEQTLQVFASLKICSHADSLIFCLPLSVCVPPSTSTSTSARFSVPLCPHRLCACAWMPRNTTKLQDSHNACFLCVPLFLPASTVVQLVLVHVASCRCVQGAVNDANDALDEVGSNKSTTAGAAAGRRLLNMPRMLDSSEAGDWR